MHEAIIHPSIPLSLRWKRDSTSLLDDARNHRCIWLVDIPRRYPDLRSCCFLLGQDHQRGPLLEFNGILVFERGILVFERGIEHRNRPCHLCSSYAGPLVVATPKEAKVWFDACFRRWWIVSPLNARNFPDFADKLDSVCVTSILRLHSIYVASVSTDITWDNVAAPTRSAVEVNVGIICACLPTLRPLISRIFPALLTTTNSAARTGKNSRGPRRSFNQGTGIRSNASGNHEYPFDEFSKKKGTTASYGDDERTDSSHSRQKSHIKMTTTLCPRRRK